VVYAVTGFYSVLLRLFQDSECNGRLWLDLRYKIGHVCIA